MLQSLRGPQLLAQPQPMGADDAGVQQVLQFVALRIAWFESGDHRRRSMVSGAGKAVQGLDARSIWALTALAVKGHLQPALERAGGSRQAGRRA